MMIRLLIRAGLVLLVSYQIATPCAAIRSYSVTGNSGRASRTGYEIAYGPKQKSNTGFMSGQSPSILQPPARRGLGISAWGIIILVVALILAGVGMYYFSICYPAICMNRNKYNMMGLPPNMV